MRVVSRLFEIDADIAKASSRKYLKRRCLKSSIVSVQDFNQALMDLGSAVCTPTSLSVKAVRFSNIVYLSGR